MNKWMFRYFHLIFIVFTKISYPICVDPIFFLFSCLNSNRWRRSRQPTPTRPPSLHSRSFLSFYSTVNPLNNLNNSQVPKVKSERGSVTRPQGSVRERERGPSGTSPTPDKASDSEVRNPMLAGTVGAASNRK